MKQKFVLLKTSAIFMLLLFLTGCSSEQNAAQEKIPLDEGWSYSLEEDGSFTPIDKPALSNLENVVPGGKGFIWLKNEFEIPEQLKDQPLGIYLGRIALADETFVNKILVGKEGSFPPDEFSAWNTARYYSMPSDLIQDGKNTITVKIWVNGEGSIVSNPFIGKMEKAKKAAAREGFWNSKLNLIFAIVMIVIGAYHLMVYFKDRKDKENLMFALINIISATYLSVFFYSEIPGFPGKNTSFLWFQKIFSNALPFLFPFLITSYILSFVRMKEKKSLLIIRSAFAIIPIVIVMFAPNYQILRSMRWTQLFLIPPMIYVLFIIVRAMIAKNKDARVLLIGFSPMVAAVLIDLIIHNMTKLYDFPYISSIGWQLVVITLLFIMANRFVNSRKEVEDLNKNLEKKVSDRTAQLSESNQKLSDANAQLEITNAELTDAKYKADRDMKLAVYVQNSFYRTQMPSFNDWEIAYTFNPAAGVSGDLYDFFHDGKNLQGVGLFDVSGHGIASGLVTMLAKSIIDRKFKEGLNQPLSNVMEEIDRQIVSDKGDIENYLTGVMLRTKDDKIEFISAGHPTVFFRNAKTGTVYPVEIEGKETDGGIIGIAGLDPKFTTLKFAAHKGDSILLYTDCLNESKNTEGEQFGEERILKTFGESGSGNAQQKLDHMLDAFSDFTKGTEQKDDLTVIVLQKN